MNVNLAMERGAEAAEHDNEAFAVWWKRFLTGQHSLYDLDAPPLNVVDLFCASGGFGTGAALAAQAFGKRAVFRAIADADEAAMSVYARSHPVENAITDSLATIVDYSVEEVGDKAEFDYPPEVMNAVLENEVGNVDLLVAGPPCQGHSNLNNHTRRNDPRNDLFVTTAAVAVALEARVVVVENVRSVVRSHGDVVALARKLLESEDYAVTEKILKMKDLGGWQTRERYFMIAVRDGDAKRVEGCVDRWLQRNTPDGSGRREPLDALWAISDLQDLRGETIFDTTPVQGEENARRIKYLFDEGLFDLPNHQRPDCHKNGTTYGSVYGRMRLNEPAPTITTGIGTPGQGRFIHPTRPRMITPHEAARIQCFPDGYGFLPPDGTVSRKDLAKWIGDAVPPLLGMVPICAALSAAAGEDVDMPW